MRFVVVVDVGTSGGNVSCRLPFVAVVVAVVVTVLSVVVVDDVVAAFPFLSFLFVSLIFCVDKK